MVETSRHSRPCTSTFLSAISSEPSGSVADPVVSPDRLLSCCECLSCRLLIVFIQILFKHWETVRHVHRQRVTGSQTSRAAALCYNDQSDSAWKNTSLLSPSHVKNISDVDMGISLTLPFRVRGLH